MVRNAVAASLVAILCLAGISIAQSRNGEVNGSVTDAGGGVIPGATVTFAKGKNTRTTQTDANGQYAITNLPRGNYMVRFELLGFQPTNVGVSVDQKPVRLDAVLRVREIVQQIETYAPQQGEVAGTVKSIEGFTLPGAHVTLKGPDTVKGSDTRTAQTDKNGKYAFQNLRRGIYIVGFQFAGYQPTYVKLNVSDKPLKVDPVLPVGFIE